MYSIMKRILVLFCITCISLGIYAHTVTLIPNSGYEKLVPLNGVTKVSDGIFGLAIRSGARNRIVDKDACKLKRCMIFSCDYELERGKIINITDDVIVVRAVYYYYDGSSKAKKIEVLPRTFSRLMGGEGIKKIICTFDY